MDDIFVFIAMRGNTPVGVLYTFKDAADSLKQSYMAFHEAETGEYFFCQPCRATLSIKKVQLFQNKVFLPTVPSFSGPMPPPN